MEQEIRFCTTSDGVRIAYATVGDGPAFVWVPGWLSHLEISWADAWTRSVIESAARHFTIVRYDKRGTGLSDREITDYSLDARVLDLSAVVDDLKLKRFALQGTSEGGPVAIAYAASHPRRVSRLILFGTYSSGPALAAAQSHVGDALIGLIRAEWGLGSQTMSNLLNPGASAEHTVASALHQREAASPEFASRMIEEMANIDVSPLLPKIKIPTLVVHGRADAAIPFEMGRQIASAIPGARLHAFEGGHIPMDPATYSGIVAAQREFLMDQRDPALEQQLSGVREASAQPSAFRTVLFTDLVGHTEMMSRLGDKRGRDVLREHERITREVLKANGGTEVKTMGDGFMASFGSVTKAVECAVALQKAVEEWNTGVGAHHDAPLRVRVGLNAGEPIEEDGDLFGATVILASRIAAKAAGGEILVADTVRGLCSGKGFLFSDRGEFVAKGFDEAVRVYEVSWRDA